LISEATLVTLAAQITTTPIILYHFQRLSLVTLLTNACVLPIQPAVMISGGLSTIAGMVWLPAGKILGWVAWLFLTTTIEVVRLTARVPFAWVDLGPMQGWMLWATYGLLAALTAWVYQSPEQRADLRARARSTFRSLTARVSDRAMLACSALLLLLTTIAWRSLPDGRLHLAFLDVGQGDALFITTPSGRQILVDGGPSPSTLLAHLGRRLPFYDHSLDLVVLSHPDDDVLAGLLPVVERYRIGGVIARDVGCRTELCVRWQQLLDNAGMPRWRGEAGLRVWLDEGLLLSVLHPGPDLFSESAADVNDNALVLRLDYGEVCFLLPGDVGAEVEARLVADGAWLDCTVLKAAYHGDAGSTSEPFLAAVDPEVVVISVGAENRFRHPHWEMLERIAEREVYRTDRDGTVELISDGRGYRVETAP
jgi:competence protein ComEC